MIDLEESAVQEYSGRAMAPLDKKSFKYRQLVRLIKLMAAVCRLRLVVDGKLQSRTTSNRQCGYIWPHIERWWPEMLLVVCIVCKIHILAFLYYKYTYDLALFQLEQIKRKDNGTYAYESGQAKLVEKLTNTLKSAGASIDLIGGQRTQDNFIVQQMCSIVLVAGLYYYLFNMYHFRTPNNFSCNSLQDLLDHEREQAKARDMVESLVDEIHLSRTLFYRCFWQRKQLGRNNLTRHLFVCEFQSHRRHPISSPTFGTQSNRLLAVQVSNERLRRVQMAARWSEARHALNRLRDSGALWPINKTTQWIERRLEMQFYIFYTLFLYCWAFIILALVIPLLVGSSNQPESFETQAAATAARARWLPSPKSVNSSLMVAIVILAFPGSFYWSNLSVTEIDSIQSINELIRMVDNRQLINSRLLEANSSSSALLNEEARKKANENLLLMVVQYKIAALQFGTSIAKSLRLFVGPVLLGTLMPVQVVLHRPYVDTTGENFFISFVWILYAIPSNVSIYPTCLLYVRCQRLFIRMTRLLAHTVEVNERLGDIYDEHTVSILRKELEDPGQAIKRFESSAFGISCTNKTYCNWNFWLGVMLIVGFAGKYSTNSQMLALLIF